MTEGPVTGHGSLHCPVAHSCAYAPKSVKLSLGGERRFLRSRSRRPTLQAPLVVPQRSASLRSSEHLVPADCGWFQVGRFRSNRRPCNAGRSARWNAPSSCGGPDTFPGYGVCKVFATARLLGFDFARDVEDGHVHGDEDEADHAADGDHHDRLEHGGEGAYSHVHFLLVEVGYFV